MVESSLHHRYTVRARDDAMKAPSVVELHVYIVSLAAAADRGASNANTDAWRRVHDVNGVTSSYKIRHRNTRFAQYLALVDHSTCYPARSDVCRFRHASVGERGVGPLDVAGRQHCSAHEIARCDRDLPRGRFWRLRAPGVHNAHDGSEECSIVFQHHYRIKELAVCDMSSLFLIALE